MEIEPKKREDEFFFFNDVDQSIVVRTAQWKE
jgi:hypothetical protein